MTSIEQMARNDLAALFEFEASTHTLNGADVQAIEEESDLMLENADLRVTEDAQDILLQEADATGIRLGQEITWDGRRLNVLKRKTSAGLVTLSVGRFDL